MTFDRRRSELEARSLRRLDLPRVYHENQIAELDAHNSVHALRLGQPRSECRRRNGSRRNQMDD